MKTPLSKLQLWGILASLMLLIVAVIVLDTLPTAPASVGSDTAEDTADTTSALLADTTDMPAETTAPADTADTEAPPQTDSEMETTAETVPDTPAPPSLTVTFLGACAPGSPLGVSAYGSLNGMLKENGPEYFLSELKSILSEDDVTVAANSCIFTSAGGTAVSSLSCMGKTENADIYAEGSVDFVSLAAPLFAEVESQYLSDSADALEARDIRHALDGECERFEKDGISVAVLCFLLEKGEVFSDEIQAVKDAAASADTVMVYFWGGAKNSYTPEEWLSYTLRQFADAGASVIVGCGNDVLRPIEEYKNSLIVYSLGTLLDGTSRHPENATALLQSTVTKNEDGTLSVSNRWIPCYVYDSQWQPCVMPEGEDLAQVNAFLSGSDETPVISE